MRSPKYSAGPWELAPCKLPWHVQAESNFPGIKADICQVSYLPNARLIAAAPELLESLQSLVGALDRLSGASRSRLLIAAKKAISKATESKN